MTHPLGKAMREALKAEADPVKAPQMQRYMKSVMPFYGVNGPAQKRLWRQVFAAHPLESCDEMRRAALDLWRNARYREERYAALALSDLRPHSRCQTLAAMPMYEEMIVTGAWWDYVDWIASHQLGAVLRHDPKRMKTLMRRWAKADDSLWKRRAAILCQLRFKQDTDFELLCDCIDPNLADRDFFIRKAIGWALRQYAGTDARGEERRQGVPGDQVQGYVSANRERLSPLSVREALKNIGAHK